MGYFLTHLGSTKQREYVNIPVWHEKGYTGKDLTVFCDDMDSTHREAVADIIQVILPGAKIYTGSISNSSSKGIVTSCYIYCNETNERLPFDDFIKKYDIGLINNSTDGGKGDDVILPIAEWMKQKIKEHNLIFCGAYGNIPDDNDWQGSTQRYHGACISVTCADLKDGKAVYGVERYGPNVDFAMFHGFQNGTSFASPFLLGMAGLLRCKYPNITQDEVYEYFKDHCEDLGLPGKDFKSGWGLPIMGEPKTTIKIKIGDNKMTVDGREVIIDQPAEVDPDTDRALLPVRAVAEALGATVSWDQATQTVTIER